MHAGESCSLLDPLKFPMKREKQVDHHVVSMSRSFWSMIFKLGSYCTFSPCRSDCASSTPRLPGTFFGADLRDSSLANSSIPVGCYHILVDLERAQHAPGQRLKPNPRGSVSLERGCCANGLKFPVPRTSVG